METRRLTETEAEHLCRGAGLAAAEVLPDGPAQPDPRQWAALQTALALRKAPRRLALRLAWLGVPAAALAATALVLLLHARPAPLTYLVEGCTIAADGQLTTAPGRSAAMRFSDGSTVTLAGGSQGRIATTGPGASAEFVLDDGRVELAVHHGPRTRWAALAGPFRVEVTGTKFEVDWSRGRRRFAVNVHEGRVIVRGGTARDGVSIGAGERLVASLDDGTMDVIRASDPPQPSLAPAETTPPAATLPAAVPQDPEPEVIPQPAPPPPEPRRLSRPARSTLAAAPAAQAVPTAPTAIPAHEPPPLESPLPPPVRFEPAEVARPVLGAGGDACSYLAQYQFEVTTMGFDAVNWPVRALGSPEVDHTHSWCGTGSLRLAADYRTSGPRNRLNQIFGQSGDVSVRLPSSVDMVGRTASVHIFADAPADAEYGVAFYAVSHGRWCFGHGRAMMKPGRWNTAEFTFPAQMTPTDGPEVRMDDVWRLGLVIYAEGSGRRDWTGAVYIDDMAIR